MEQTEKSAPRFHYALLIVAAGIAITCFPCALVLSCAGIFFTPVSEYFGVARAEFTLYFSILNIFMMLALPVAGKLMSRFDLRIVLSTCVVLCGGACLAMSQFNAVWQFYVAGAVLGAGVAPLIYLAVPTLINAWCARSVGFFVGLCMAFTGIGGVVFNPVGTALIQSAPDGWRMGYFVFGVVILVATLPFTLFVVRSNPSEKGLEPYGVRTAAPAEEMEAGSEGSMRSEKDGIVAEKAMKTSAFFALAAFCGIITINQTIYQFMPSYAQSFAGTAPQIAALSGVLASSCMAGQAVGKVFLGIVNDRSVKGGVLTGVCSGVVGLALMWLVPQQAAILLVGGFLFGIAYACTTVQTPLLTRSVFGSRDYTNIYARVSMVGALASAFAAVFWGVIVDSPLGFPLMFILGFVCLGLCLASALYALAQAKKFH